MQCRTLNFIFVIAVLPRVLCSEATVNGHVDENGPRNSNPDLSSEGKNKEAHIQLKDDQSGAGTDTNQLGFIGKTDTNASLVVNELPNVTELPIKVSNTKEASDVNSKKKEEQEVTPDVNEEQLLSIDPVSVKVLQGERDGLTVSEMTPKNQRLPAILHGTKTNVYSVDFHWTKHLIFFSADHKIYRARLEGKGSVSDLAVIVDKEVDFSVRLAVDWVNDKIYWMADKYQTVEMANLDGSNRTLLIDNIRRFEYPNNIAVDPYEQMFFFVSDYAVFKCKLDGTDVKQVYIDSNYRGKEGRGVRCIALDRVTRTLYFSGKDNEDVRRGAKPVYIAHANYNGTNVHDIETKKNWHDVFNIEVFRNTMYLAHYDSEMQDSLWSLGLSNSSTPQKRFVPKNITSGIWGIRVYHPCVQKPANDSCWRCQSDSHSSVL